MRSLLVNKQPISFLFSCDANRKRVLQAALKKNPTEEDKEVEEEENEEMSVSGAAALDISIDAAAVRADFSEVDTVMTRNKKEWR